ncbi:MAG: hypothetical protein E3J78_07110, partial [Candidatus Cloacimonadota bacterium]
MNRILVIALPCVVLLFLIASIFAQGYVFGPNIRVNDDPAGSSSHWAPHGGQRGVAVRGDTVYC